MENEKISPDDKITYSFPQPIIKNLCDKLKEKNKIGGDEIIRMIQVILMRQPPQSAIKNKKPVNSANSNNDLKKQASKPAKPKKFENEESENTNNDEKPTNQKTLSMMSDDHDDSQNHEEENSSSEGGLTSDEDDYGVEDDDDETDKKDQAENANKSSNNAKQSNKIPKKKKPKFKDELQEFEKQKEIEIKGILTTLIVQFINNPQPNWRKGGLWGLASATVALAPLQGFWKYSDMIIVAVLNCFRDTDPKVRFAACEALFNVAKQCRNEIMAYFNQIFDGLLRLTCDSDSTVRNASVLLDRLLKDIVSEDERFDVSIFIPVLSEHINTNNPFCRTFLISWMMVLDSVPDIDLVAFLPNFLPGLFQFLGDPNRVIVKQTLTLLTEFLVEIKASKDVIDFGPFLNIMNSIVLSTDDEFILETALMWIYKFLEFSAEKCAPFSTSILKAILPCVSHTKEVIRKLATKINTKLCTILTPNHFSVIQFTKFLEDIVNPYLSSIDTSQLPTKIAALNWVYSMIEKQKDIENEKTFNFSSNDQQNQNLNANTENLNTRWLFFQFLRKEKALFFLLMKSLCDPSEEVVEWSLKIIALLISISTNVSEEKAKFRAFLTLFFALIRFKKRELGTANYETLPNVSNPSETNTTSSSNLLNNSNSSEKDKKPNSTNQNSSNLTQNQTDFDGSGSTHAYLSSSFFSSEEFLNVLNSDSTNTSSKPSNSKQINNRFYLGIQYNRACFIIRRLCDMIDPEKLFKEIALILDQERNSAFCSACIQMLNYLLLTIDELQELRTRLRSETSTSIPNSTPTPENSESSTCFFDTVFQTWCKNSVAALSLCLLSKRYDLSFMIVSEGFKHVYIDVNVLVQLDQLIQLLESPSFLETRLELLSPLGCSQSRLLVKTLFGILMILPQKTESHEKLRRRLQCVDTLGLIQKFEMQLDQQQKQLAANQIQDGFQTFLNMFIKIQDQYKNKRFDTY